MNQNECWSILQLEPTDDTRAIKRAYADALRTIDVDQDPAAFTALRDAFEDAKFRALYGDYDDYDDQEEGNTGRDDDADPADLFETAGYREDLRAWIDPAESESTPLRGDDHLARLHELLLDMEEPTAEQIEAAVGAIVSDDRMDELGFAIDTERQLACMLADGMPRSDPALAIAINAFGWHRNEGDWKRDGAVAQVMQRYRDRFYLADIGHPDSYYRSAYRRLAKPPPSRWSPRHAFGLTAVRELLEEIRSKHPTVELHLDPDSVRWWEHRSARDEDKSEIRILRLITFVAGMVAGAILLDSDRVFGAVAGFWAVTLGQLLVAALTRVYRAARSNALFALSDEDRPALVLDACWLVGLPGLALWSAAARLSTVEAIAISLAAITLAALATVRGIVPGDIGRGNGAAFVVLAGLWWIVTYVTIPDAPWRESLVPILSLCWAGIFGIDRIDRLLDRLGPRRHRIALSVHALLGPLAVAAILRYSAPGAIAVSIWMVVHHGLTSRLAHGWMSPSAIPVIGIIAYHILGASARAGIPGLATTLLACLPVGIGIVGLIRFWKELHLE